MPHPFVEDLDAAAPPSGQGNVAALLAGVLDSAMDAIISVDGQQKIVFYNRAAQAVFGWPRDEIIGAPLERLLPERFRAGHAQHLERFADTGVTSRRMGALNVIYGLRANGQEFPLDASISQLDTTNGKLFTVILRDITGRLEAEEKHARLAARLSGLLDSAMDAIITVDAAQTIVLYNRAAEKTFGRSSEQALGKPLAHLMPERFRSGLGKYMLQFGRTGVTSRRIGNVTVIYGLRENGEEFPMDASISQLDTPEGKLFTVILRDITDRVRAQEERSAFAASASAILEEEKSRFARELHDEHAQSLTALKLDTNWVRDNAASAPVAAQQKLTEMLELLDGAVASTRRIAADLRPLLLDDLGLGPAIEWLAGSFTQRHGVPCRLRMDKELELQEPHATAVFRIVQESLNNVAKHADASDVVVTIERHSHEVVLSVRDNGRGFDAAGGQSPGSLGHMGLRERAQLLKGRVEISSAAGEGARIEVWLPLAQAKAQR